MNKKLRFEDLPMTAKLKDGHKEAFVKDVTFYKTINDGHLGWSGQAKAFIQMGLDKKFINCNSKKSRTREKAMKKHMKQSAIRDVFRHFEGWDDNGYYLHNQS